MPVSLHFGHVSVVIAIYKLPVNQLLTLINYALQLNLTRDNNININFNY